ncbi:MAG: enoyl-CoA hydratase/isomerase family protein [Betaproteobacteria bacterium]|nr:enoyl-CoA hydratase/isomerase family protein [Betaproteobacteria bacterium]
MSDELIRKHDGNLTRLTLHRPTKANALSATLVEALLDAVDYAYTDGTRLLVLEGAGNHFCAGFDFNGYQEQSEGDLALRFIRIETLLQAIHHAPFETLALAHGRIFGAGADLVAACGQRIAAPGTSFRMPGLRFGVVLGTRHLTHRVGADHARSILGESRAFGSDEALSINFITTIAEAAQWNDIVQSALAHATALTPAAAAALYRQTTPDTRAEDMTALARSVSVPGIKERIRLYRNDT